MKTILSGLVAVALFSLSSFAADPDADTFAKSMKYTQEVIAKHHLIALVEVEPFEGGKEASFRYDRYPTVERVQMKDGTYARKKGAGWLKSDDYGDTGTKVKPAKTTELDALVSFADAPLSNRIVSKDKAQGGTKVEFLKREDAEGGERLFYEMRRENSTNVAYPQFVFRPWKAGNDDESLLIGYGGLMRTGDERVKVNINYQYMFLVNAVVKVADPIPKAEPEDEKPSKNKALPKAADPNADEEKPAAAKEDDDKVFDFFSLQQKKKALNGKVVRLGITTENALGKEVNGLMHVMVHDTAKPGFIGFVDFPKAQYKALGFGDRTSKESHILYVRVVATDPKEPATFTALGRKMVKGKKGESAYEW